MRVGVLIALIAAIALLVPTEAEAGRKIIFYQSGEDIFEAGPLPAPYDKEPKLAGVKAGFKCKIFGLFWAYMHIWDCQPVAMRGDTYMNDAKLAGAIGGAYKEGDMQVGLWTKHGRWVLGLIVVGIVVIPIVSRGKKDGDDEDEEDDEG